MKWPIKHLILMQWAEFIQADNFTPVKDAYGNITGWGNADIK